MGMTPSAPRNPPETFRARVHDMLRTSILDAAWTRAKAMPWSQVRIADIAEEVGVSRQTIHNEFGTKDQLAEALFARDMSEFLQGIEALFASEERVEPAIRKALLWMLDEATRHDVVTRMVADARRLTGEPLHPVLTVRCDFIVLPVRQRLVELVTARWPEVDPSAVLVASDMMVRFVLSQILLPTDLDRERMVDGLVGMAMHLQPRTEALGS